LLSISKLENNEILHETPIGTMMAVAESVSFVTMPLVKPLPLAVTVLTWVPGPHVLEK
jgi:putative heme iron utilization protein